MGEKLGSTISNIQKNSLAPGPGQYNPNDTIKIKCYSLGGKSKTLNHTNEPGPGSYETKSTVVDLPSSMFGKERRNPDFTNKNIKTPGPGS